MYEIKKFNYKQTELEALKEYRYGINWPIIYILEDGKEAYIGQAGNSHKRAKQHMKREERSKLDNMYIIADDEYNTSATLDIESLLIRYVAGDGSLQLQNKNSGITNANYYDKERYQAKFEVIWKDLLKLKLVKKSLLQIKNSDLFKYSPYKALNEDQLVVIHNLLKQIESNSENPHLVSGEPGTGKTIVATYLMKLLQTEKRFKHLTVGLVIPMTSLRKTLKKVFKSIKGLNAGMVIGPNDVVKKEYDILIVDEAHRLQRRVNLTNYASFDQINKNLDLNEKTGTQLDWIIKSSKHQILFYDKYQSIKPADIQYNEVQKYHFEYHELTSQMRIEGGDDYIKYIQNIFDINQDKRINFYNYDLKLFDNIQEMVDLIKEHDQEFGLSRLLAGYAWKWKTKDKDFEGHDIVINNTKLKWNSVTKDWVNSLNAINEVGCIHTIQGYDLNYAGVIIGPEISYDKAKNKIVIDKHKYLDFNGKRAISDPRELEVYIKNIYKTLLTRGIKGTYIYVVDEELREYLGKYI